MIEGAPPYRLGLSPGAQRSLSSGRIPEGVALAVVEFMTATIAENPRRVGKQLRGDMEGLWSARRGTYRILYRVSEEPRVVFVVRIDHRRDAYRPR